MRAWIVPRQDKIKARSVVEHRALIDNSDSLSAEATPSMLATHGLKNFSSHTPTGL
jgi:hypothetical protein